MICAMLGSAVDCYFFDLDKTLYDYDFRFRLPELARLTGQTQYQLAKSWWAAGLERRAEAGEWPTSDEYLDAFAEATGSRRLTLEEWASARALAMTRIDGSVAALRRASELGTVSLLSNNPSALADALPMLAPDVAEILGENVLVSYQVMRAQADPRALRARARPLRRDGGSRVPRRRHPGQRRRRASGGLHGAPLPVRGRRAPDRAAARRRRSVRRRPMSTLLFIFDMDDVLYDYDWRRRMAGSPSSPGSRCEQLWERWWVRFEAAAEAGEPATGARVPGRVQRGARRGHLRGGLGVGPRGRDDRAAGGARRGRAGGRTRHGHPAHQQRRARARAPRRRPRAGARRVVRRAPLRLERLLARASPIRSCSSACSNATARHRRTPSSPTTCVENVEGAASIGITAHLYRDCGRPAAPRSRSSRRAGAERAVES